MKQDPKTGQSKGFGFIHFSSYEVQERVLEMQHLIEGRWCNVKIPDSKVSFHGLLNTEKIVYIKKYGESRLVNNLAKCLWLAPEIDL